MDWYSLIELPLRGVFLLVRPVETVLRLAVWALPYLELLNNLFLVKLLAVSFLSTDCCCLFILKSSKF